MAAQQPSAMQTSPDKIKETMKTELKVVKEGVPGHSEKRFAWNQIATTDMDERMNEAISLLYHNMLIMDAANSYFDRDNVALPNIALWAKISATDMRNIAFRYIDFQNKRGAAVKIGAVGAPPSEFHSDSTSDVLQFFQNVLAATKAGYTKANNDYAAAVKAGDGHAAHFLEGIAYGYSSQIQVISEYLTHLTLVASDKFAIKQFDRSLGASLAPLAMAAGLETTLPSRLVMGAQARKLAVANAKIDASVFTNDMNTGVAMNAFTNSIA